MKSFHFSVGNSTDGPIGLCGTIRAMTKESALNGIQRLLPSEVEIKSHCVDQHHELEYVRVYISAHHIKLEEIDEE